MKHIFVIIMSLSFLLISCSTVENASALSKDSIKNNFRNAYDYKQAAYAFFAADTAENPQNTSPAIISSKAYDRGRELNIHEYKVSTNRNASKDLPAVLMTDEVAEEALLIAAEMSIQEGYDSFVLTNLYEVVSAVDLNRPYYTNVNVHDYGATATTYGGPYTSYSRVIHFSFLAFNKNEVDFTKSIVLISYSYPVEDKLPAESDLYRTGERMKEINDGITKYYAAGEYFDTSYAYKTYYDAKEIISRMPRHIPWIYDIEKEEPLVRKEPISSYKKNF